MAGGVRLSQQRGIGFGGTGPAAWLTLSAIAAVAALLAWPLDPSALDWQPGRWATQPWRWWTAGAVHLSALHLGANLAGTAVVAALGVAAGCGRRAALAWALAWPLCHLGLLVQPELLHYGGLSGVLHAAVAVAAVRVLGTATGLRLGIGVALLAGLLFKLLLETPWHGPLRQVPGWDIAVAPLAHATGAAAGLFWAWVLRVWR